MAGETAEAAAGAKPTQIDPEKLKHRLQIVSKVGRGAFGTVYKGASSGGPRPSARPAARLRCRPGPLDPRPAPPADARRHIRLQGRRSEGAVQRERRPRQRCPPHVLQGGARPPKVPAQVSAWPRSATCPGSPGGARGADCKPGSAQTGPAGAPTDAATCSDRPRDLGGAPAAPQLAVLLPVSRGMRQPGARAHLPPPGRDRLTIGTFIQMHAAATRRVSRAASQPTPLARPQERRQVHRSVQADGAAAGPQGRPEGPMGAGGGVPQGKSPPPCRAERPLARQPLDGC